MLYLIRTFCRLKKTYLKIGFTDNINLRFNSYEDHNPFFENISSRPGGKYLEMKLHLYLKALGYKEKFKEEWFIDCPEVISLFHQKLGKINKTIWMKRDILFSRADFKETGNQLKKTIYEELRMLNKIIYPRQIDREWKIENNQRLLKNMRKNPIYLD